MRLFRCFLAAALAAGIVTMVTAQQGQRPNFGRGGGFDLDDLVFTNTALQEDLKVTDAQKEKLKPVAEKLTALSKKRGELFGKGFKGVDKDKAAELREEGKKVAEEQKKVYDEVITADQKKRLKQIQIQVMSLRVFNDPEAKGGKGTRPVSDDQKAIMKEVQEALKLSDSQKSSIKGITSDYNKESQEIFRDSGAFSKEGFDQEKAAAANKKIEKVRQEAWGKVQDLLDDSQKKAWKELTGEPFPLDKLRPAPAPKKD
jgi:hypothetical protein